MGMTDKQYDGMLLDWLTDLDYIEEAVMSIPDCQQKDNAMERLKKLKDKTERKLESPIGPR